MRRRLVRLPLVAAALAAAPACARDAGTTVTGLRSATDVSTAGAPAVIFSERFTRTSGAPDQFSREIQASDFEGPFTLTVTNGGGNSRSRVSSAELTLDGTRLLSQSDFSKVSGSWTFSPDLGPTASLAVSLASGPGSFIEVALTGYRRVFHVCPGVEGAYQTIGSAVDAAGSGSTIKLCDGVHVAESVVIDRPLTIMPEPGAHPVVENSATTGALVLSGPATGTVSLVGIRFENKAGPRDNASRLLGSFSVRATGSALGLTVSNSSFSTTTIGNGGIAFTSNGASLDVDGSSFTGGLFGIYADAAGTVTVRGSRFTAHDNFGGRLGAATVLVEGNTADHCGGTCWVVVNAQATITGNSATACGSTACASASNSAATISGNDFANRLSPAVPAWYGGSHSVIYFFGGSHGVITDNDIDGCGFGQCIMMFDSDDQVVEVAHNRITSYYSDRTRIGIIAGDGFFGNSPRTDLGVTANIHDNVLLGVGGNPQATPNDTLSYAYRFSGIHVEGHSTATVSRNSIVNAMAGILVRTAGRVSGEDNTSDLNRFGIQIVDAGSVASIHRSDFTRSLVRSIQQNGNTGNSLTCNYWGQASGPVAPGSTQGPSLWTPFTTQPIAGSAVSCP